MYLFCSNRKKIHPSVRDYAIPTSLSSKKSAAESQFKLCYLIFLRNWLFNRYQNSKTPGFNRSALSGQQKCNHRTIGVNIPLIKGSPSTLISPILGGELRRSNCYQRSTEIDKLNETNEETTIKYSWERQLAGLLQKHTFIETYLKAQRTMLRTSKTKTNSIICWKLPSR